MHTLHCGYSKFATRLWPLLLPGGEWKFPATGCSSKFPFATRSWDFPKTMWVLEIPSYGVAGNFQEPGGFRKFPATGGEWKFPATACRWEFPKTRWFRKFPATGCSSKFPKTRWFLDISSYARLGRGLGQAVARNFQKNHVVFGHFQLQAVARNVQKPGGFWKFPATPGSAEAMARL